ncbi:MAG: nickel/cobalt transporter (NicO) family protein [Chloroflexota bacterium]|nr:nickel/cobalt transporter (NicO) family protein [Chloroflexota bacterium]
MALLIPALAAAHPLGNFTINHYTGIRIEPDRILLDVVLDQAEIPTFTARLDFDTDGDGEVSDAETDAGRAKACQGQAPSLALAVDGVAQTLTVTEAGLSFPPGVGGLSTMRLVCVYEATLTAPLAAGSVIDYADTSFADRLGWREIVATGSGVRLAGKGGGDLRSASTSARLTLYPTKLLTQALADTSVAIVVTPGGPRLGAFDIPDASPLTGPGAGVAAGGSAAPTASALPAAAGSSPAAVIPVSAGSVPGGVTNGDLPSIFRSADLSPIVLLVSILTAAALGAGHALTPGHGKTLMAAYLVGTRGTPLHAAGLGLSVTLSHTIGILVLAGLVVGAQGVLPPDLVVKIAPFVAALSIVLIGGWMLFSEGRRRWRIRGAAAGHLPAHTHGDAHEHDTFASHDHPHAAAHDDGPAHDHDHDHEPGAGEHSHGGARHSHLPPAGATISWRSLFVLGLAGGLIPSASALLILLGSIAAGRPAFGFVLVVAFGLGMALVMSGIGLALVVARGRLDRVDSASTLGSVSRYLPLVASFLVFGLGIYLTFQAVAGNTTF